MGQAAGLIEEPSPSRGTQERRDLFSDHSTDQLEAARYLARIDPSHATNVAAWRSARRPGIDVGPAGDVRGPGVLVRNKPYVWTPKGGLRWTLAPGDLEPITNPRIASLS